MSATGGQGRYPWSVNTFNSLAFMDGHCTNVGLEGGAASIRKMGSFCQNLAYSVWHLLYNRRFDFTVCVKAANCQFAP